MKIVPVISRVGVAGLLLLMAVTLGACARASQSTLNSADFIAATAVWDEGDGAAPSPPPEPPEPPEPPQTPAPAEAPVAADALPHPDSPSASDAQPHDEAAGRHSAGGDEDLQWLQRQREQAGGGFDGVLGGREGDDDADAGPVVTLESLDLWGDLEPDLTAAGRASQTVNAMVGQVNANPIYASDVLDPEHEQLEALAQRVSPARFRQDARQIIAERLVSIVRDELMLADARRELNPNQQRALDMQVREHRQELLRRFGRGSASRADAQLRQLRGMSLEEAVSEYRQALLLNHFRHQKLTPRVHVSRRDIERYYEANYEQFNPPPARRIHLIRVANALAANRVDRLLEDQPFKEVAREPMNQNNPDRAGYLGTIASDSPFEAEALNAALLELEVGQHSPRIDLHTEDGREYCWVYIDDIEQAEPRPLEGQVQLEIAEKLRNERLAREWRRYQEQLFSQGNFKPVEHMTEEVLAIAEARYLSRP